MLELLLQLKENDGFTLKNGKLVTYKRGYNVGVVGFETENITTALQVIQEYNGNCGVWYSGGIYYIDKSIHFNNKENAIAVGIACNQLSIYGWHKNELIWFA